LVGNAAVRACVRDAVLERLGGWGYRSHPRQVAAVSVVLCGRALGWLRVLASVCAES